MLPLLCSCAGVALATSRGKSLQPVSELPTKSIALPLANETDIYNYTREHEVDDHFGDDLDPSWQKIFSYVKNMSGATDEQEDAANDAMLRGEFHEALSKVDRVQKELHRELRSGGHQESDDPRASAASDVRAAEHGLRRWQQQADPFPMDDIEAAKLSKRQQQERVAEAQSGWAAAEDAMRSDMDAAAKAAATAAIPDEVSAADDASAANETSLLNATKRLSVSPQQAGNDAEAQQAADDGPSAVPEIPASDMMPMPHDVQIGLRALDGTSVNGTEKWIHDIGTRASNYSAEENTLALSDTEVSYRARDPDGLDEQIKALTTRIAELDNISEALVDERYLCVMKRARKNGHRADRQIPVVALRDYTTAPKGEPSSSDQGEDAAVQPVIPPETESAVLPVIPSQSESAVQPVIPSQSEPAAAPEMPSEPEPAVQSSDPDELRMDGSYGPYTQQEFVAYYGAEEGLRRWVAASPSELAAAAPPGQSYEAVMRRQLEQRRQMRIEADNNDLESKKDTFDGLYDALLKRMQIVSKLKDTVRDCRAEFVDGGPEGKVWAGEADVNLRRRSP